MPSRVQKSILNARINFIFYFVMLVLCFIPEKFFWIVWELILRINRDITKYIESFELAELGVGAAIGFNLYKPIQREIKVR